ncbi:MAG: YggT family protein [Methylophilaceae bacterium]
MIEAADFLLDTVLGLFTLAALLRFYLQWTRAPYQNPVSQTVVAVTDFAVKPLRRVVPSWSGLDLSTLVLAFFAQLLLQIATLFLRGYPILVATAPAYLAIVGLTIVALLRLSVYIFMYAVVIQALISWVNPYTPLAPVLDSLTRPLLNPLRRRISSASGIDFTPLIVLIGAQLLLMLIVLPVTRYLSLML